MDESWWENPVCWICNYWWVLLIILVLGLSAYFTRNLWRSMLGFGSPTPPVATSQVVQPSPAHQPVQTLGTGDVQVTLTWWNANDLDLHVIDPSGEEIFYGHDRSASNGILDVDANANCVNLTNNPVENVYWPTGRAPQGSYTIEVVQYKSCSTEMATAFQIKLLVDGQVSEYSGNALAVGERYLVTTVDR